MIRQDTEIVRELSKKLVEIAGSPENEVRRRRWADHNDLISNEHTLLWVCPDDDGGWQELVPPETLKCSDPELRELEVRLRRYLYQAEHFPDDFAFEPWVYWTVPGEYTGYTYGDPNQKSAWGIPIHAPQVGKNAYHLDAFIQEEEDFEPLLQHEVDFIEDTGELHRVRDKLKEALGGIIDVRFQVPYIVLVQSLLIELVHLRGLENLMYDLYDIPDLLQETLHHMAVSKAALLKKLEREHRLYDNRSNVYTGSGSLGYTNAPRKADEDVLLRDMWGFADAQEFSEVSAEMFESFALENQKIGLNLFGRACYGCCEPLDDKFDAVFRHLGAVRRLSVSPWCSIETAAEKIGRKAIYSWKPNPSLICTGFDEGEVTDLLKRVRDATKENFLEIILKDIRTCANTPVHLSRFITLVRNVFGE